MNAPRLLQALRQRTGIDLEAAAVTSAVRQRLRVLGTDSQAYENEALHNETELQALIDLVVVPESWFFRDEEAFDAAVRFARERVRSGGRLRALSVPCACGEEPYSLAIALREAGIDPQACELDALDVSPGAIERARNAVYSRNAFRSRDLSFRDRHFSAVPGGWRLHEDIRSSVRFACDSLLSLIPPDPRLRYDIVFCRNLLIYFDAPTQALAASRLHALLRDDGILFAGYAETMPLCRHGFQLQPISRAFAMTKTPQAARPARTDAWRRPPAPAPVSVPATPPAPAPAPAAVIPAESGDAAKLLARARELADKGAVREAQMACRQCLELTPDKADAWFLLGLLCEQAQDAKQAMQCLRRAVYLDPDHYEALCLLALLAERLGDRTQAQRCRQRAARVHERLSARRTGQ